MVSPFTGGKVTLIVNENATEYRKEKIKYVDICFQCNDTKQCFTKPKLGNFALQQVYNQYRCKYNIPYAHEIAEIRKHYGLSCAKMSVILGFGEHQLKNYEDGDMPSVTNGKILANIMQHDNFLHYVEMARNQFSDTEYKKLLRKIQSAGEYYPTTAKNKIIFGDTIRGEFNGFAPTDGKLLQNIVSYILQKKGKISEIELNRILFALDILKYSQTAIAATGLSYQKYSFGIGVKDFAKVFAMLDVANIDINPQSKATELSPRKLEATALLPDEITKLADQAIDNQDISISKSMNELPMGEPISFQKAIQIYYTSSYKTKE